MVKAVVCPAVTVALDGWVVIDGATAGAFKNFLVSTKADLPDPDGAAGTGVVGFVVLGDEAG